MWYLKVIASIRWQPDLSESNHAHIGPDSKIACALLCCLSDKQ